MKIYLLTVLSFMCVASTSHAALSKVEEYKRMFIDLANDPSGLNTTVAAIVITPKTRTLVQKLSQESLAVQQEVFNMFVATILASNKQADEQQQNLREAFYQMGAAIQGVQTSFIMQDHKITDASPKVKNVSVAPKVYSSLKALYDASRKKIERADKMQEKEMQ